VFYELLKRGKAAIMKIKLCVVGILIFISLVFVVYGSNEDKWYNFCSGQIYISDFTLNPGKDRGITIMTQRSHIIIMKIDATTEQAKKYKKLPNPVQMKQTGTDRSCAGIMAAGRVFSPINGRIQVRITNNTQDSLRIAVAKTQI
jgi:hypothetical protein